MDKNVSLLLFNLNIMKRKEYNRNEMMIMIENQKRIINDINEYNEELIKWSKLMNECNKRMIVIIPEILPSLSNDQIRNEINEKN